MNNFFQFQVGSFNCIVLRDNSAVMSIQKIFPDVAPEKLKQAMTACGYESDEVTVGYDLLYLDTGQQKVLVDTGLPQERAGFLADSLQAAGLSPADIETIIITHSDGDHIGGVNNFPNARFVLPQNSWELWTNDLVGMIEEFVKLFRGKITDEELAARAAGREEYGRNILPALRARIDLVEPEVEFIPGIKFVSAPGHRRDHTAVEIKSSNEALLHVVDSLRHPIQFANPEWSSFIDSYRDQTVETNKMLLKRAAQSNALIFGSHITFPGLGRIRQSEAGCAWQPIS